MDELAVSAKGVYKNFLLPHEKVDSVKGLFTQPFKKREKTEVQHALKNINFDIKKGEFFGIVGRNGSGKSTLLKIIAGIYQPSKGSISVNGRLVPFIELGVGFNPELTGRENVFLNGALMGFSRKEIKQKYDMIVEFAELERFMDQKLKNYSSGMQVRLAFSVATKLAESDILLIDEVLAVGDADFQRKCFEYFRKLKKDKKTVIFVSHDMNAVREYCDRAVLINDSEVIASGTANKIAREYDKLFAPPSIDESGEPEKETRWGDQSMRYSSVKVEPKVVTGDEPITIRAKIKANADVEGTILGFSIKSSADVLILGNNTKLEGIKLENIKKGEVINLEWQIPSILGDGDFFVNVAAESLAATPFDWWDEAKAFQVKRGTPIGMVAYPPMKFKTDRK